MNSGRKTSWRIMIVVLILSLASMACGLGLNGPNIQSPDFEPVEPENNEPLPTLPPVTRPQNDGAEQPQEGTQATEQPQTDQQIPETGGMGDLADPVAQAPENLEELYELSSPGTVSILVEVNQGGMSGAGAGSGFVLTDDGYVVTNHHVVEGATDIVVRFFNDTDVRAEVIGTDPNSDLAVIKVERLPEGAYPLPLGDSDQLRVGDAVVAIGNPFSLGTSMSYGIVSAVNRAIPSGFTPFNIPQAIQTDAAINPGNSGGPLINMNGEVIGINAQIRTSGEGGGNVGIGFAIPVNILKLIYEDLIQTGAHRWPYLGVSSPVEAPTLSNLDDPDAERGAFIAEVQPGGPADQAGLREGDVVIQADDREINDFDDLLTYIAYKNPGDQMVLIVLRNGQEGQVTVTLGERPTELIPEQ